MVLMGHLKEFMRTISMSGGFAQASTSQNREGKHAYAMQTSEEEDGSNRSNGGTHNN